MRRYFSAAVIVMLCLLACLPEAGALSDAEYKKFMKNPGFAAADKELTRAYNEAKKSLSKKDFAELREEQREWVASGRDEAAEELIEDEGISRIEAYAQATFARAQEILEFLIDDDEITGYYDNGDDIYLHVELYNRASSTFRVKFSTDDDEWEAVGKIIGTTITVKNGGTSATLTFGNNGTIKVKTNAAFKRAEFNADGTYKKHYGK